MSVMPQVPNPDEQNHGDCYDCIQQNLRCEAIQDIVNRVFVVSRALAVVSQTEIVNLQLLDFRT